MKIPNINSKKNNVPLSEKLTEARIARGYSISELAEKLGVTRQAVSQFELGHNSPSGTTLAKYINVLKLPLSYFFTANQSEFVIQGPTLFRSMKTAKKQDKLMLEVRTKWLANIYSYLEQYLDFPEFNKPDLSNLVSDDKELKREDIEEIASFIRKSWGLGLGPISNVTLLLENQGVIVAKTGLNHNKICAFSQWMGKRPIIFLGPDKDCVARSRFSIIHELAHLLLHMDSKQDQLIDKNFLERIEKEANQLSAAFLLPRDTFGQEVMSTSLEHFITLKERWKVSIQAMITRCESLGIFSDSQILYLRKQISKNRMKTNEPLDDVLQPEHPIVLRQAIELLLENKVTTVDDILNNFSLPAEEIEELCSLPKGSLSLNGKIIPLVLKKP